MFKSIIGALIAHKQLLIAAVPIGALLIYTFSYALVIPSAYAQSERTVPRTDPCTPYCHIAREGTDGREIITRSVPTQLHFSFLP